jgi:CDP-paratose 2-epimerase
MSISHKNILITGGCGFVGSNIALKLKELDPAIHVMAFDSFVRNGSRMNVSRLEEKGIQVMEGDVRDREGLLTAVQKVDLVIDCAAEPSVLAGTTGSPLYVTDVNLGGTLNCLELVRQRKADFVFLSTSRVYPVRPLASLVYEETDEAFVLADNQAIEGVSAEGIAESFPLSLGDSRTLYGSTKLCSELLIQEFRHSFGLRAIINRCGVIAGPWQFGKVDQGIVSLWMAHHVYGKPLSYIGFGGRGKQARDIMHIDDLWDALLIQLKDFKRHDGEVYNLGGGQTNTVSLRQMTGICQKITGSSVEVSSNQNTRAGDIPMFVTDHSKFTRITGWQPKRGPEKIFADVYEWIMSWKDELSRIL